MIRVRVRGGLRDQPDDHVRQVLSQRNELVDGGAVRGDHIPQLFGRELERDDGSKPVVRGVHRANCSRNLTSESYSKRMSGMPYRSMAMRAGPIPNAQPV